MGTYQQAPAEAACKRATFSRVPKQQPQHLRDGDHHRRLNVNSQHPRCAVVLYVSEALNTTDESAQTESLKMLKLMVDTGSGWWGIWNHLCDLLRSRLLQNALPCCLLKLPVCFLCMVCRLWNGILPKCYRCSLWLRKNIRLTQSQWFWLLSINTSSMLCLTFRNRKSQYLRI